VSVERYFGLYHGVVVNDADPDERRRLQVQVPDVFGHGQCWAQACVPVGSSLQPAVGSVVWVMFEAGDPGHPVWIGTAVQAR
jgi:Type VI secretion system/phage-baseplate injector OB domain